jgi:hypothetical protein
MALIGEALNRLGREYDSQGKATTFGADERMRGKNAIGGFTTIIERSRLSCRIVLSRWNRSFQP